MTTRHYLAIAGLLLGILGLATAVTQPFASRTIQWVAFGVGTAGFISGMLIATTTGSEPMR